MSSSLQESFHLDAVDQGELYDLLLGYYGGASHPSPFEIILPGERDRYALKLVYDKTDRLVDVVPGPLVDAQPHDIPALRKRIETELLRDHGTRIARRIMFADQPVNGSFRY